MQEKTTQSLILIVTSDNRASVNEMIHKINVCEMDHILNCGCEIK